MVVNTKENGWTTTCMVKECTHGETVENIMETTNMTRSMAMEHTLGLMEENTKANGLMGSKSKWVLLEVVS